MDLSVPTNKEIPGLVTVTVEYHVVVVSDQAVFKSPKHKDTDVVQFMVGATVLRHHLKASTSVI